MDKKEKYNLNYQNDQNGMCPVGYVYVDGFWKGDQYVQAHCRKLKKFRKEPEW